MIDSSVIGKTAEDMLIQSSVFGLDLCFDDGIGIAIPSYAFLFHGMTFHKSEILLSKLAITVMDEAVVEDSAQILPHSSHLKELSMPCLVVQTNCRLLLTAIGKNGTLHRADAQRIDQVWQKLVPTYCQRNEFVPKFLAQSQSYTEATDGDCVMVSGIIDP
jgi:hypothetical protein